MRLNTCLLIVLFTAHLSAQLLDNVWCMGYESIGDSTSDFGGQNLDFRFDPPKTIYRDREADFDVTSSSISDKDGNLLFYTNGCKIYTADDKLMKSGDSLTAMDNYWTQDFWCPYGFTANQGALILPSPGHPNQFYLIHQDVNTYPNLYPKMDELYVTKIDMDANNGKGEVVSKRNLILSKLCTLGSIAAVKHANGVDWWVVISSLNEPEYNIFLISADGIQLVHVQNIGSSLDYTQISISAKFSPDGRTYARFHLLEGIELLDFNRFSGQFENFRKFPFWEDLDNKLGDGLEFSPDSKKLYLSYNTALFQIDLEAEDVFGSLQLIDTYRADTSDFFDAVFYQMQLAPNGKIYMSCLNGESTLHVINNPNKLGKACEFEQRGFKLRTVNAFTMPYFPNFRLGPDTTSKVQDTQPKLSLKIYPNPSYKSIYLSGIKHYEGKLVSIFNSSGQLVQNEILTSNKIDVSGLNSGVYMLRCNQSMQSFIKVE